EAEEKFSHRGVGARKRKIVPRDLSQRSKERRRHRNPRLKTNRHRDERDGRHDVQRRAGRMAQPVCDQVLLGTNRAVMQRDQTIEKPECGQIAESEQRSTAHQPESNAKQRVDVRWNRCEPEPLPSLQKNTHWFCAYSSRHTMSDSP